MAKAKKPKPAKTAESPEGETRSRIKRYLIQRFYTRFHMSLILMSAGFAAMLSNWVLLRAGLGAMWLRYPIAISLAYLTFLAGVWLWLQYAGFRRESAPGRSLDGGDLLDGNLVSGGGGGGGSANIGELAGGGGSFDGGGAAGEWAEVSPVQAFASSGSADMSSSSGGFGDTMSGIGKSLGDFGDLDGEAIGFILIALLLICSVLILSGYIVWFAPDILGEAVFGATLAGSLARTAKRQDEDGWVMGVVKKTWWPFAIVFSGAFAFAIYAAIHYPGAKTFGEAMAAAVAA
jgi:hypothetical protein